jgi:hypothetical protein
MAQAGIFDPILMSRADGRNRGHPTLPHDNAFHAFRSNSLGIHRSSLFFTANWDPTSKFMVPEATAQIGVCDALAAFLLGDLARSKRIRPHWIKHILSFDEIL